MNSQLAKANGKIERPLVGYFQFAVAWAPTVTGPVLSALENILLRYPAPVVPSLVLVVTVTWPATLRSTDFTVLAPSLAFELASATAIEVEQDPFAHEFATARAPASAPFCSWARSA